ncbi:6-phosphofructokinase [Pelotomaculum propionicicum]|uniref:Pyrophosphate--fructose 6-phosphate 1-phosphotransferase n=1 Tax=Pelotomaculum propionicicum TaxID=258475 RepID=A0A4Y7RRR9_9FIRM|nr:6-phosphofructokinase [Pelotomaculum propionicicum]NLI14269.1 6-phosphofructokinase [Peptococcaceae bacterium]TEB10967.1 Pyrophosphate--fructose 6-phosphate 1-phosphotransferase [Pelotomaculum propionicicum]
MATNGKVLIAQSGGPTAVINQTLAGIVLEARKYTQVSRVYGALRGVEGIVNEDLLDLTQETTHNLEQVALTPSSALLSTRIKPDSKYCHEIFKVLKAHDIRYFFYIGGNDSADTARIVNEEAELAKYDLRVIHVPKTIDNDLMLNDHTPGFGSAARFVTQAFMGVNLDVRALNGVYIGVVMGRHAGFLTASSAIARKYDGDGPHLIYLPERTFSMEQFLLDVKEVYDRYGICIIAVSEGIRDASGAPIVTKLRESEKDAHGNVQLSGTSSLGDLLADQIRAKLNIARVRSDTFGYLQRSFFGCVSDIDQHEAREVGERAVQMAMWNDVDGSVTIRRTGNYSVDYVLDRFEDIAAQTRVMPDEFINSAGNHVTDAFKFYVRPLLGSGLPQPSWVRAPKVPKLFNND